MHLSSKKMSLAEVTTARIPAMMELVRIAMSIDPDLSPRITTGDSTENLCERIQDKKNRDVVIIEDSIT